MLPVILCLIFEYSLKSKGLTCLCFSLVPVVKKNRPWYFALKGTPSNFRSSNQTVKDIFQNEKVKYSIFVLVVLLSRLPFLTDGYGLDGDSWAVVISALDLHTHGFYLPSRLPGYPVQEWLTSLVIRGGPLAVNGLTAIVSTIGFLFFAMALRALRFRSIFLASFALAAVPVIYIHSTTAIDYNFALAFILIAFYFTVTDKALLAGLFIGMAIGCRITSGAMLIPFGIILMKTDGLRQNLLRILRISASAILIGGLAFVPVFRKFGWDFFTYYDVPYPAIPKVLYKFSIEVWGIVGLLGLLISTVLMLLPQKNFSRKYNFPRSVNEKYVVAWLIAIDLYIIAFLKLPMESGYLIPIIPFVILIFGKYLYERAFTFLCITLIVSPFLCTISPADRYDAETPSSLSCSFAASGEDLVLDVLNGPVIAYKSRRENGVRFTNEILKMTDTVTRPSVLVAGRWFNQMVVQSGDTTKMKINLRSFLDEAEAVNYYAKGYVIYYMPRQDYYNQVMRNVNLDVYGAVPFIR